MPIPENVRAVVESGRLAHLITLNPDGSPQVSCVWVGVDGDELVTAHLRASQQKIRNVGRDPRVALSIETETVNAIGLREYLVVHGDATIQEGGAPELLQRLAYVYLGPGVKFPPMDDPPAGNVMRIVPKRYGGIGPWA